MIRPLRLADAAALLLFLGRSPVNEARARGRLGDKAWGLAAAVPALKDCLSARDSHLTYVCSRGGSIQGLACLQSCRGPQSWEVERLLFTPGHEECGFDLLERLGGAKEEIGHVFLRLSSDSPVLDTAKRAGYGEYLAEALYQLDTVRGAAKGAPAAVRLKTRADDHNLFRLYSSLVPLKIRSVMGMTFEEWRQNRDRGAVTEYVREEGGELTAWMRVRREGRASQFDVLTNPGSGDVGSLVDHALSGLSRSRPVYCLVPEFEMQQQQVLEERGFRQVAEFSCLSKQYVARVHEPQLVPLSA